MRAQRQIVRSSSPVRSPLVSASREAARDHAGDELDLEASLEKAADELSYASHGSSVTHVSGQSLEKLPAIPAALPAPAGAPDDGTASSDFT